ncbi:hypothetical protein ACB092_04G049000 [Castanea dentata]
MSSRGVYFHTVICNSPEFHNTASSHELHYITWDNRPGQHAFSYRRRTLTKWLKAKSHLLKSCKKDDHFLDNVDKELLGG